MADLFDLYRERRSAKRPQTYSFLEAVEGRCSVKFATRLLTFDPAPGDRYTPANTPIYQTATFRQDDATEFGEYDYCRSGNPTRPCWRSRLRPWKAASRGFCFTTGLAAITAVTRLVSPGEEIVACDDLYGGTYRLFSRILAKRGIDVRYVDFSDLDAVAAAISGNTKLVYLETPDQSAAPDHRHPRGRRNRASLRSAGVRRQQHHVALSAAAVGAGRGHRSAFRHQVPLRPQRRDGRRGRGERRRARRRSCTSSRTAKALVWRRSTAISCCVG